MKWPGGSTGGPNKEGLYPTKAVQGRLGARTRRQVSRSMQAPGLAYVSDVLRSRSITRLGRRHQRRAETLHANLIVGPVMRLLDYVGK